MNEARRKEALATARKYIEKCEGRFDLARSMIADDFMGGRGSVANNPARSRLLMAMTYQLERDSQEIDDGAADDLTGPVAQSRGY